MFLTKKFHLIIFHLIILSIVMKTVKILSWSCDRWVIKYHLNEVNYKPFFILLRKTVNSPFFPCLVSLLWYFHFFMKKKKKTNSTLSLKILTIITIPMPSKSLQLDRDGNFQGYAQLNTKSVFLKYLNGKTQICF